VAKLADARDLGFRVVSVTDLRQSHKTGEYDHVSCGMTQMVLVRDTERSRIGWLRVAESVPRGAGWVVREVDF